MRSKRLCALLLVFVLSLATVVPAFAADDDSVAGQTRYNLVYDADVGFTQLDTLSWKISAYYEGVSGVTGATIEMQMQYYTLIGFFDYSGYYWSTEVTGSTNGAEHTFEMTSPYYYRVKVTITVHTNDGDEAIVIYRRLNI